MRKEDCEIGMRIICPKMFYSESCFKEETGTIVFISDSSGSTEIGVEWDIPVKEIFEGDVDFGHDCNGYCKNGYGFFGRASEIEPLCPSVEDEYDFKISIESLF